MQRPKRPFTVEIRASRLSAARRDRGTIWANVDLAKALREVEQDLLVERVGGGDTKPGSMTDPTSS